MSKPLRHRRPSAPTVLSSIALFVSLGGAAYAANGGPLILGQNNSATVPTVLTAPVAGGEAMRVNNSDASAGSVPLALQAAAGHAPLSVNTGIKVDRLNVDRLDDLDSSAFLRKGVAQSVDASGAAGVVDVTNTGFTNGIQGRTGDFNSSGVYGEHIGPGGFGIAGRAGDSGHAIYGDNTGTGYAGYFEDRVRVGGNLELQGTLDCNGCVAGADVNGKVNDSDRLDGIDSGGFMQAFQGGIADGQAIAEAPGSNNFLGPAFGGFVRLQYQCPSPVGGNGALRIINASTGIANFFVDSGGANPDYLQLASGGFVVYPAAAGGESFSIQAQGSPGVATVQVATVHRNGSNDCHAQALGVVVG